MTKDKEENKDTPDEFKGDGIKTTVTKLKDRIQQTLEDLKDLATLEVRLPVDTRMRKILESIRKKSSAEHLKMHITALEGKKHSQDEATIHFSVYETDGKGNKKLYEHKGEVTLADGKVIKRTMSAEYRVAYEVVETIKYRKPLVREIIRVNEKEQE